MQEETRIEGRCIVYTSMGMAPDGGVCRRNSCKNGHMPRITKKLVKTLKAQQMMGNIFIYYI